MTRRTSSAITCRSVLQEISTVLSGVKRKVSPATKVTFARGAGCARIGPQRFRRSAAGREGRRRRHRGGRRERLAHVIGKRDATDGEGYDVASLDLTGVQEELVRAVHETGTPTVVVLINGRPLSTRWVAEHVPAVVEAWLPGERGGEAVADILFGETNPSGRLPVTVPRHVGQLPAYYNYKPSKEHWIQKGWGKRYVDMPATPLFAFGHGLSYTTFEYSGLAISPKVTGPDGSVSVSVSVRNSGAREGSEVVQLYLRDVLATVSRPVMELRGFEKIRLKPGETKTASFTITRQDLTMLDQNLKAVVEPGTFRVMVGHSSADIRLSGEFAVQ